MIFKLIKNELIKLMKRPKTWIVFIMFAITIGGIVFLGYRSSKTAAAYRSPEGQIKNINDNINNYESKIEDLKNSDDKEAKVKIENFESIIKSLEEEKNTQEELLKHVDEPDYWKKSLNKEKEDLEKNLKAESMSQELRETEERKLKQINACLDNNIKPVEGWEFDSFNAIRTIIEIFGFVILTAGIAVFMSDIVAGEATPPTLKFLLVQPISRGKVILSKFIAVVLTVVAMIGGLELLTFGAISLFTGVDGGKTPEIVGTKYELDYSNAMQNGGQPSLVEVANNSVLSTKGQAFIESFLLQILFIVACCAFIFLISSLFKSSMSTMAVSVIICVATSIISRISSLRKAAHLMFLNYGDTHSIIDGSVAKVFTNPNFSLGLGIVLMVGTIIISYVIAHIVFSKKDMLV